MAVKHLTLIGFLHEWGPLYCCTFRIILLSTLKREMCVMVVDSQLLGGIEPVRSREVKGCYREM